MSNQVLPYFPGLAWSVLKSPQARTLIHQAVSGKELRLSLMSNPLWAFTLTYELLRAGSPFTEYQQLVDFWLSRAGSFDSFLFHDDSDSLANAQSFGAGNGTTAAFQLVRQLYSGGFNEPIQNPSTGSDSGRNLIQQTENLSLSPWVLLNVTVTPGATTAPNGSAVASGVFETTANAQHVILQTISNSKAASGPVTATFYAKDNGSGALSVYLSSDGAFTNNARVDFTLSGAGSTSNLFTTALFSGLTANIQFIGNGWYRCTMSVAVTDPGTQVLLYLFLNQAATYVGTVTHGTYVWGVQVENRAVASPYMPNQSPFIYVNGNYEPSSALSSPSAPSLSSTGGGTLGATTYYVKITYVGPTGETLGSTESSLAVAANNVLVVTSPATLTGATGWNVYVSTSTGTETKQNGGTPIAIGTNWTEPTSGLVAGASLPSGNTTGWTLGSTGIVTFNAAPANGAALTWTGSFFYRVRFKQDTSEFEEFVNNFWLLKKLELQSVKL